MIVANSCDLFLVLLNAGQSQKTAASTAPQDHPATSAPQRLAPPQRSAPQRPAPQRPPNKSPAKKKKAPPKKSPAKKAVNPRKTTTKVLTFVPSFSVLFKFINSLTNYYFRG